ncbi:hypothetical protein M0805_009277 [Coniferiporia weirii]|nr:hypothetical protein M0805_009277 [Coniferiporia weirii]
MLSAIAARKAARAAKLTTQPQTPLTPDKNAQIAARDSGSESERLGAILRPQKSKRKTSASSEVQPGRKKKRKDTTRGESSHTRYYEPSLGVESKGSTGKGPKGIINGTTSSSESGNDDEDGVHFVGDNGEAERVGNPPKHLRAKRAWSPSQLPPDSSDEEVLYEAAPAVRAAEVSQPPSPQQDTGFQRIQTLSFSPQPDKNVFRLDGRDSDILTGRVGTLVALQGDETIALLGVYSLTILRGSVSLMGSDIAASSNTHAIFAPKCSPIPIIKALSSDDSTVQDSAPPIPDRMAHSLNAYCAVIFFEGATTGVEGLGRVCKTYEDVFEAGSSVDDVLGLHSAKLLSSLDRSMYSFQTPVSWQNSLASLPTAPLVDKDEDEISSPEPTVILVRGQKRTGKSTLARTIMNRLLGRYRRVAFLECDIGQTEFTPPGLVSLNIVDRQMFGPPFTHPLLPYASHYIGSTSPRNSPSHYLSSIRSLIQTYKIDLQYLAPEDELLDTDDPRIEDVIPLVVNTMGWTKGLGADLARQIIEAVEPTHIFSMQSPNGEFETGMDVLKPATLTTNASITRSQVFEIEPIAVGTQSARYSAADWRAISLMSYFHSVLSPSQYRLLPPAIQPSSYATTSPAGSTSLCHWDCRLPLLACAPYSVSPSEAFDSIILIGAGSEDVVPTEVGRVLNGALVALVASQPDYVEALPPLAQQNLPYMQGAEPPDPSSSHCIGLALVRSVSQSLYSPPITPSVTQPLSAGDALYIVTPLASEFIAASAARCLVKGEIELPIWGMLDFREVERDGSRRETDEIPFLQWNKSQAAGAERRRVRRNLMRRGQM